MFKMLLKCSLFLNSNVGNYKTYLTLQKDDKQDVPPHVGELVAGDDVVVVSMVSLCGFSRSESLMTDDLITVTLVYT